MGNGTSIDIVPGKNIDVLIDVNIIDLENEGENWLYIRTKDSRGNWSLTNIIEFYIDKQITLNTDPEDGGEVDGEGWYEYGYEHTVYATPETGFEFDVWKEDGEQVHDQAEYSFTVTDHRTLTAVFNHIDYNISLFAEPDDAGEVIGEGSYNFGEVVEITADPYEGWVFVEWTGDTEYLDDPHAATANVTMPADDVELTANFEQISYTLSLTANPENGGNVNGEGEYHFEEVVEITAEAHEGWAFIEWTGDTEYLDDSNAATANVTMPADDVSYKAKFEDVTSTKDHGINKLLVFSNPTQNKFYVESNEKINQIRLININGQVIKSIIVDSNNAKINVKSFLPGIYFLQIQTKEKVINKSVQITR